MTAVLRDVEVEAQVLVRGDPQPGFPAEPNTVAGDVLWLGPDEWLVLGGRERDYSHAAAAVDVSANRVVLELAGADAAAVLARGCSLDLHPDVFAPGRCAQTLLGRAEVVLHRVDAETFRILVRPSFAGYLRTWVADALLAVEGAE